MKHLVYFSFLLSLIIMSCSVEEKEINYGEDKCHYCEMTIVDNRFASELVNDNGKAFMFDATECMIHYLNSEEAIQKDNFSLYLAISYDNPNKFIDATNSYYLISENLPSPMGAYLSVYPDKETAGKYQTEYGGTIYDWEDIRKEFNKK